MIRLNFKTKLKTSKKRSKVGFCFSLLIIFLISFCFIGESVSANGSNTIKYTEDIYKIAETNGIAHSICQAIEIGKILMIPMFAIMFSILGLSAYQGKVKWSTFVTFALGMAAFKAAGPISEFFMPGMGLQYGCKCAIEREIRDVNGNVTRYATGLNYDCSEGTKDYEEEYGS